MNGYDILVNRKLSLDEIRTGLASALGVTEAEIVVVADISSSGPIPEGIAVLCEFTEKAGDFNMLLAVYIRKNTLAAIPVELVAGRLCEKLRCICLIGDESVNPFTMLLIKRVGKIEAVSLDSDLLEREIYTLHK